MAPKGLLVPFWWSSDATEKYWVEIRYVAGIGRELRCPDTPNPWYELVGRVQAGDIIHHWHAHEHRFVGRSEVQRPASVAHGEQRVELYGFTPLHEIVDRSRVAALSTEIYAARRLLQSNHPHQTLYLRFQFRADGLRLMSNYFAKLPKDLVDVLFGVEDRVRSSRARARSPVRHGQEITAPRARYPEMFRPKADTEYITRITGGIQRRERIHESLVNSFVVWLQRRGLNPARNHVIDIGLDDPPLVIEAKVVHDWPTAIRQALGQLYEYRYFQLVSPNSALVFLASKPVPSKWQNYLERDRGVAVVWRDGTGFRLSAQAQAAMRLTV